MDFLQPSAPLSLPSEPPVAPAMPPRPVSGGKIFRLFFADPGASIGLILMVIGLIFAPCGITLLFSAPGNLATWIFIAVGLGLLAPGGYLVFRGLRKALSQMRLLRAGQAVLGQIDQLGMDYSTTVNNRHPWIITYHFSAYGGEFSGRLTTLRDPGAAVQNGSSAYILYNPDRPEENTLYMP